MLPTEIPFGFPFWKIITITSTSDDISNRSEIIGNEGANEKHRSYREMMLLFFNTIKWMTKIYENVDFWCFRQLEGLLSWSAITL